MQTKTTEMKKMFGWYDPVALLRAAGDVVYSSINGRHADHRLIEAITPTRNCGPYDYTVEYDVGPDGEPVPSTRARQEIWIDYVSDVGDGWDSTYAIAFYLSQGLSLEDASHKRYETKRGAILIMGGDEVYPTASRSEYESRLVGPYEAALKKPSRPIIPTFLLFRAITTGMTASPRLLGCFVPSDGWGDGRPVRSVAISPSNCRTNGG